MKEVSIILPVYNDEYNVKTCINSLLKQSYKYIELIIINDASTDSTLDIIKKIKNKKLKIINLKKNQGTSYAKNRGLKTAKGKYIFFTESDATYKKDYIKKAIDVFRKNKNCGGVIGKIDILNKKSFIPYLKSLDYSARLNDKYTPVSAWFFQKKLLKKIGGFRNNLRIGEDVELGHRVKKTGRKIYYINQVLWLHKEPTSLLVLIKKAINNGKYGGEMYKYLDKKENNNFDILIGISLITLNPIIMLLPIIIYTLSKIELWKNVTEKRNLIQFILFKLLLRYSVFIGKIMRLFK